MFTWKCLKNVEIIIQDFEYVLLLNSKLFWKLMVKKKQLFNFIDYFLCFNRGHHENFSIEDYCLSLLRNKLQKSVLKILYRLSLSSERENRIKNFKIFILNGCFWNIFRLFDLCVIFKSVSIEIVRRILENLLKYKSLKEGIFYFIKMIFKTFELIRREILKKKLQLSDKKKKLIYECIENIESLIKVMPEFTNFCEPFKKELVTQFQKVFPFLLNSKILEYKVQLSVSSILYFFLEQTYSRQTKIESSLGASKFAGLFNFSFFLHVVANKKIFSIIESGVLFNVIFSYYPMQKKLLIIIKKQ